MEFINTLWVEKYRPKTLDDYIGNEDVVSSVMKYIQNQDIPHLLLHGKPGTGKTTLTKIIIEHIDCDYIIKNASDENSVDDVRGTIKEFASSMGFGKVKIVVLDEADFLTPNAQAALRNLMETFSGHCRFILTCNYIERIKDAIQSRCQMFSITPPSKKEVAIKLAHILESEGIEYTVEDIGAIVRYSYPDIRGCINFAQKNSVTGKLKLLGGVIPELDMGNAIINILTGNMSILDSFNAIRQIVADSGVSDFSDTYRLLYDEVDTYSKGKPVTCILVIADHVAKDALVIDKEITFMSCVIQLLSEIK